MPDHTFQLQSTGKVRILGVDPGTATTGYGIIELSGPDTYDLVQAGIIKTTNDYSQSQRLSFIRRDILSLLCDFGPDVMAIESIFFFKNAKTIVPVAQARGVILEAAASTGLKIAEYTPMQVKMNVAGYGKADKLMMQKMVQNLLSHEDIIRPDDAADAVAIAICHARCHRMQATVHQHTA